MDNAKELVDQISTYILTSMQASVLISNLALSKILGEGLVAHYETCDEDGPFITLGVKPNGEAVIFVLMENVSKIYFLECRVDEKEATLDKKISIIEMPTPEECNAVWDNLLDDLPMWTGGGKEKIEIKY